MLVIFLGLRFLNLKLNNHNILEVHKLRKYFPVEKGIFRRVIGQIKAVDGIDLNIQEGETLGLAGESGCGKTTVGRTILRLTEPTSGNVLFYGATDAVGEKGKKVDVSSVSNDLLKSLRRDMQIIYQDPYSSLNPRSRIMDIIAEPLIVHGISKKNELKDRVSEILTDVGIKPEYMMRYPHEFSGGQRQRIGIARAIALKPKMIVADEPVSALDVSVQAQVINLLEDLQQKYNLTYLFITHDLSVIKHISIRVAIMYLGKIVEIAKTSEIFENPKHPYTEALISAVPIPDPKYRSDEIILKGDVPSPLNPPDGCYFHPRCRYAKSICSQNEPYYRDLGNGHFASCHFADSLNLRPGYKR